MFNNKKNCIYERVINNKILLKIIDNLLQDPEIYEAHYDNILFTIICIVSTEKICNATWKSVFLQMGGRHDRVVHILHPAKNTI